MSRKPTIKISYPEASEKALQLTEAMVKRAPGKRIVETESEDPIFPDGGELFSGFIRCKTQTGVELTLTLNSSSMDYALETLIRPNLTTDERKRILGEDSEQTELALTPGEQEKAIEIGKVSEKKLRDILNDMIERMEKGHGTFDAINHAVWEMKQIADEVPVEQIKLAESWVPQKIAAVLQAAGCSKKSKMLDPFARGLIADLEKKNKEDEYYISLSVLVALTKKMAESKGNDPFALYSVFGGDTASWEEIEQEARKIGQRQTCTKKSAAPLVDTANGDDEVGTLSEAADGEIEPGLLNDIDTEGSEE